MNNKKSVFIVVVVLLVACSLTVGALFLLNPNSPVNNTPVSYPTNVIDGENGDGKKYIYTMINDADNIKLKTSIGEELLINIETRGWKNIKWSLKGSYVGVLGQTKANIYNLYVYNLKEKKWILVTNFDESSVTSFEWIDNDTLLFTQDGWLHRYKYSTITEVVKIYQTNSVIKAVSPNNSTIIMQRPDGKFQVLSIQGKLLFELDKITIENTNETLPINDIFYNKNSQGLLFISDGPTYYKWDLGDSSTQKIEMKGDLENISVLCSQEVNVFKAYKVATDVLKISNFDIDNKEVTTLAEQNIHGENRGGFTCTVDNKVEFFLEVENKRSWYELSDEKIERVVILDEAKEMDIVSGS